jgi:sugar (pentulose or hexulose) kinase
MGIDILVPVDTEITATGVALLAGVGTDIYSDVETGIKHALSSLTRYRPDQQRVEQYDKLYEQYTALLDRMAEVWRMQAETRDQLSNQSER